MLSHSSTSPRLNAARNLLQTLSCTTLLHADEGDLGRVTQALHLLLDDGCDVLQATQCKALRERAVVCCRVSDSRFFRLIYICTDIGCGLCFWLFLCLATL
ncbi:hypothetical protein EMIT0373P_40516 [Pseudomonas chlororaphis]